MSGNRTPVSRVAGENSTTEPTMPAIIHTTFELQGVQTTSLCKCDALQNWPRWGSNPQSSDSKSDALSIGPRGRCMFVKIWGNYLWQHEKLPKQWHWITITRKVDVICTSIYNKCLQMKALSCDEVIIFLWFDISCQTSTERLAWVVSCDGRVVKAFD